MVRRTSIFGALLQPRPNQDAPPPYEEFSDTTLRVPVSTQDTEPTMLSDDYSILHPVVEEPVTTSDTWNLLQSVYGLNDIPLFGPQYGIHSTNQNVIPDQEDTIVMRAGGLNPFEDIIQMAQKDIERDYTGKGKGKEIDRGDQASGSQPSDRPSSYSRLLSLFAGSSSSSTRANTGISSGKLTKPQYIISNDRPTSCIVCTEEFSQVCIPPKWTSLACLHEPAVCRRCLAKSIKSDLENKIWNQIKCPECDITLIHEDIKMHADSKTFAKYHDLSLRSALSSDKNFIWCQNCDFGQLHNTTENPLHQCFSCGFKSCFKHSIKWHEGLTCTEYDNMLSDSEGFDASILKLVTATSTPWTPSAEDFVAKKAEEARQTQCHEAELQKAKLNQAVECQRIRQEAEKQRIAEEKRRIQEEKKRLEAERIRKIEEMKQKIRDEQASLAKVKETTKLCPGCKWPIEKNQGCEHMTCTQCAHQFCWRCLKDWAGHVSCY